MVQPGDEIPYHPTGRNELFTGVWGTKFGSKLVGFARLETVRKKWLSRGWQTGTVPIQDFAEGHSELAWRGLNSEAQLACLHKDSEVVIITRQSTSRENQALHHHRMPVQVVDHRLVLPSKGGPDWFGEV